MAATQTHQLRSKPVEDFTVEDMRIMIGRQLSLRNLVPIAIEVLQENPLAEGHCYPGDLLQAVLEVDRQYWRSNREQWEAVSEIVESVAFAQMKLSGALLKFRARPV
jgi:contact-dependent growth inhibition (CDI) system CdiI-like immunity protein